MDWVSKESTDWQVRYDFREVALGISITEEAIRDMRMEEAREEGMHTARPLTTGRPGRT